MPFAEITTLDEAVNLAVFDQIMSALFPFAIGVGACLALVLTVLRRRTVEDTRL